MYLNPKADKDHPRIWERRTLAEHSYWRGRDFHQNYPSAEEIRDECLIIGQQLAIASIEYGLDSKPFDEMALGGHRRLREITVACQSLRTHVLAKANAPHSIPPAFRTKAMSKSRAARYLRDGNVDSAVDWLNACIADGTIACETLSRQSHVFDVRQFPDEVQQSIVPTKVTTASGKRKQKCR